MQLINLYLYYSIHITILHEQVQYLFDNDLII